MENSIDTIISQLGQQPRLLERVSTINGELIIEENQNYRWIRDNYNAYYSILDKIQPQRLVLPYLHTMMAAYLFNSNPRSILLLGAGGGGLLRFLIESAQCNSIVAIDYDQKVIDITEKYFLGDKARKKSIINIDALDYISTPSNNFFDMIFVDLFAHGTIPDIFNRLDFYIQCKKYTDSGIVIFNLIIDAESSFKTIMSLILSVFDKKCMCLTVPNYKNIIVLAFGDSSKVEKDISVLRNNCEQLQKLFSIDFDELLDEIKSTNVCYDNVLQF